jgi:hypothetical protein
MAVAFGGFSLGAIGVTLADLDVLGFAPYDAMLPGGILFVLVLIYANLFAFWCPRCGGNWGTLALRGAWLFTIESRIRYCPFCGSDIDGEE